MLRFVVVFAVVVIVTAGDENGKKNDERGAVDKRKYILRIYFLKYQNFARLELGWPECFLFQFRIIKQSGVLFIIHNQTFFRTVLI